MNASEVKAAAAGRVYVTEGEKAAEAARSIGLVATTSPHGSKSPHKADWTPLAGRDVVLLPGNDDAGRGYRDAVAGILRALDPPASVRVLDLPGLPPGGDLVDYLDQFDAVEPETLREQIEAMADVPPEWTPTPKPTTKPKEITYHRITAAELDAGSYELEYLIENTLVAGQHAGLCGGKKTLKTGFLLDLGISLAIGGHFLGKLKVTRPCRVGIMTGESGLATIQETARRICWAANRNLADIDGLVFSDELPRFGNFDHQDAVGRFIDADGLEVLGIDPAYLCIPSDNSGNLFAQGELLRGMAEVCQARGCMMLLCHHTRKGGKPEPFSPPELEDIAWSGFQEFFRQWLLVGRRERYEPGTGEHRLWLNVGGSAGHSALWAVNVSEGTRSDAGGRRWDVTLSAAHEARDETKARQQAAKQAEADAVTTADCKAICRIMGKHPDGETKTVIRDSMGFGNTRFNRAWGRLQADGDIVPATITKANGQAYAGFKLDDSTTEI